MPVLRFITQRYRGERKQYAFSRLSDFILAVNRGEIPMLMGVENVSLYGVSLAGMTSVRKLFEFISAVEGHTSRVMENLVEIVWLYDGLERKGLLKDWDEVSAEVSSGSVDVNDLLKADFCRWAEEYEGEGPGELRKFVEPKIMERYGVVK